GGLSRDGRGGGGGGGGVPSSDKVLVAGEPVAPGAGQADPAAVESFTDHLVQRPRIQNGIPDREAIVLIDLVIQLNETVVIIRRLQDTQVLRRDAHVLFHQIDGLEVRGTQRK